VYILLGALAMSETSGCMLILDDGGYSTTADSGSTSTDSGSADSNSTSTADGSTKGHGGDAASGKTGDGGGDGSGDDDSSTGPESGACTVPAGQACGVDPQCGCSSGQKCDISNTTFAAECVTAGAGESGSVCAGAVDCAAGLTCASSVCRPFCTAAEVDSVCPTTTTGPPLGTCVPISNDGEAVPQLQVCLFDCTPFPNNCPAGEGCTAVVDDNNGLDYFDCEGAGVGMAGDSCESNVDCVAGTECLSSACTQLCKTTGDCASLGADYDCDLEFTVNGMDYGVCE
jgi:hypothetical protein